MLERMWTEGNTHPLLVRVQTCATTVEISVVFSQKTQEKLNKKVNLKKII